MTEEPPGDSVRNGGSGARFSPRHLNSWRDRVRWNNSESQDIVTHNLAELVLHWAYRLTRAFRLTRVFRPTRAFRSTRPCTRNEEHVVSQINAVETADVEVKQTDTNVEPADGTGGCWVRMKRCGLRGSAESTKAALCRHRQLDDQCATRTSCQAARKKHIRWPSPESAQFIDHDPAPATEMPGKFQHSTPYKNFQSFGIRWDAVPIGLQRQARMQFHRQQR